MQRWPWQTRRAGVRKDVVLLATALPPSRLIPCSLSLYPAVIRTNTPGPTHGHLGSPPRHRSEEICFRAHALCRALRDVYEAGIKPACRDAGAYCDRVDEQIFHESILERVYNQISKADLIVADMTGRNANVFYEVGYAHALNKKTILLTAGSKDIPFDLQHYSHIVYKNRIADLKMELERRVSWYLGQEVTETHNPTSYLKYYIDGDEVIEGAAIPIRRYVNRRRNTCDFNVTVRNCSSKLLWLPKLRVSLSCENEFGDLSTKRMPVSAVIEDNAVVWEDLEGDMLPQT
jgi:hypothetical protein